MARVEQNPAPPVPVVLFPSPGMGHLVSMIELAKLLSHHGLSATILIVEPHYNTGATAPFISRVAAAHPTISFHRLPSITPPTNPSPHHEALAFDLLRLSLPSLRSFLLSSTTPPAALVVDYFCGEALSVAADLHLPCYYFYTSGANALAVFLHFPSLHPQNPGSFRDLGAAPLRIPGAPDLPADHMPLPMLDRDDAAYAGFLHHSNILSQSHGIIINTFAALEPRAIEAISARTATPPLYCIGPLITEDRGEKRGAECMAWLDGQPAGSVVFLCFGSLGLFTTEQLREIAVGLERSGQRFVWVVRSPPSGDPGARFAAPAEPDLEALMPEGWLERTAGRGLVVKGWVAQTAVLKHGAVGGFVTHCGWNSVLEAVAAGVPMVAWPLYAEQWMNKVFLVEEMGLAVEMRGYDGALVAAAEVEGKVRWLMESEAAAGLRRRTERARDAAAAAVAEGGSSHAALMELVGEWKRR